MAEIKYTANRDIPENIQGVEKYSQEDVQLISSFEVNSSFNAAEHYIELHLLSLTDEILFSENNYTGYTQLGNAQSSGQDGASVLTIDPILDSINFDYGNGGVKLLYHFLNDLYSKDQTSVEFYIKDISPDRTELKLNCLTLSSEEILLLTSNIKNRLENEAFFNEFRLNFGDNDILIGLNIDTLEAGIDREVVVKLYEPLPTTYVIKSKLRIVELVADSVAYEIDTVVKPDPTIVPTLRSANFNIELQDENVVPTGYFNYDELFSYPINNSNNQLFSAITEKGIEISVDYSDLGNFVHFSSAEERIINFKYKLDLITSYSSSLEAISTSTTGIQGISGSRTYFEGLIEGVVRNFDHYERFLYYESGSTSWPKENTTKPYVNKVSNTSEAITWYADQIAQARLYDNGNHSSLEYSIPTYLREDANNQNYLTFVHMIGQHFDNLWLYAKTVTDKYDADNRLNKGISKDLVGEALKNFGVKLYTSNKSIENLFTSVIGQAYEKGNEQIINYVTGSLIGSNTPIQPTSYDDYQKEVQKRIYHNLPLLLKSKGTERGLRALINCFGIPSDILDIKVYGGRNTGERPFYGDFQYFTSSLDKVRLDNTGSIIPGNTLSQYTSIVKRDSKYTNDIHPIEVGFSPTDNVDNYIISKSLSTQSLTSFNIDNYLGDPRNQYLDNYYMLSSTGETLENLDQLTQQIMSGSIAFNVQDYVRIVKFFDNTIFKMVKDFIPARSTVDIGIVIKPHILQRSKTKSVVANISQPEYIGTVNTAFIKGGDGGTYTSTTQGTKDLELNTSYVRNIQVPFGLGADFKHAHQEASYDGELQNSTIRVTNGELNANNRFKVAAFSTNLYDINRWLNTEGLCILNPYNTYSDIHGAIYYSGSNNTFYLNSGSWNSSDLFTGLSQTAMQYSITSSGVPTGSFQFPFNTDNYANYSTHSLVATNTGVQGVCTSSVNMQVAVCDISKTVAFRSSVKNDTAYNITTWFMTGSQNNSANVNLNIVRNTLLGPSTVYTGLLRDATSITFPGNLNDTYTLTVQDSQIPLTCTYSYNITAGACNVLASPAYKPRTNHWKMNSNLGTILPSGETPSVYNYGLARFFIGENPDTLRYRVRVYTLYSTVATVVLTPPQQGIGAPQSGSGVFYPFSTINIFKYEWTYGVSTNPIITGNVALFKISYTPEYLAAYIHQDPNTFNGYASELFIEVTALESEPTCTPVVIITPPLTTIDNSESGTCVFTGQHAYNFCGPAEDDNIIVP